MQPTTHLGQCGTSPPVNLRECLDDFPLGSIPLTFTERGRDACGLLPRWLARCRPASALSSERSPTRGDPSRRCLSGAYLGTRLPASDQHYSLTREVGGHEWTRGFWQPRQRSDRGALDGTRGLRSCSAAATVDAIFRRTRQRRSFASRRRRTRLKSTSTSRLSEPTGASPRSGPYSHLD